MFATTAESWKNEAIDAIRRNLRQLEQKDEFSIGSPHLLDETQQAAIVTFFASQGYSVTVQEIPDMGLGYTVKKLAP